MPDGEPPPPPLTLPYGELPPPPPHPPLPQSRQLPLQPLLPSKDVTAAGSSSCTGTPACHPPTWMASRRRCSVREGRRGRGQFQGGQDRQRQGRVVWSADTVGCCRCCRSGAASRPFGQRSVGSLPPRFSTLHTPHSPTHPCTHSDRGGLPSTPLVVLHAPHSPTHSHTSLHTFGQRWAPFIPRFPAERGAVCVHHVQRVHTRGGSTPHTSRLICFI